MKRRALSVVLGVGFLVSAGIAVQRITSDDGGPGTPRLEEVDETESADATPEWDYVIPAGTAERIDAGEEVEIIPAEIEAQVGESIRITNNDTRPQVLGPWYVGAGEVLTQRFASAGTFEGACEIHPSGQIKVTVTS